MFFRQLIDPDLGCASYVLGDAGDAIVVDPGLAVDRVLEAAEAESAQIRWVLETHVHADHVSGRSLLRERTRAQVRVPVGGEIDAAAGAPLHPGDVVEAGGVRVEALPAPGHRPEHLAFLVTDTTRDPAPCLLLSGDSLLIGDLARPDLAVEPGDGARELFSTLSALGGLADDVEVWPGHVGGSLCGGARLSRRPSSTLGYERRANSLLSEPDVERFTDRLVADLPSRPPTVEAVVRRNRSAAPATTALAPLLDADGLRAALTRGAVLVDGRACDDFDAGHVAGSINLPLAAGSVGTRGGWLLDVAEAVVAAADTPGAARDLARRLQAVGLEVAGAATVDVLQELPLEQVAALSAAELTAPGAPYTVVDVRDDAEWRCAHLPDAVHLPLSRLRADAGSLPPGPLAVVCAAGVRAAAAASRLRRMGHDARRVTVGVAVLEAQVPVA